MLRYGCPYQAFFDLWSCFLSETQLENFTCIKILGCIISQDLKWNPFVDFLSKKASQRVHLIICLKWAGCPSNLLFRAYCAYIRPLLLYAYPAAWNMTLYLKQKLERIEKRVLRLISDHDAVSLFSVADKICAKLLEKVLAEPLHPLRRFFDVKPTQSCVLRKKSCYTCGDRRRRLDVIRTLLLKFVHDNFFSLSLYIVSYHVVRCSPPLWDQIKNFFLSFFLSSLHT